jgi:hypothetical protein
VGVVVCLIGAALVPLLTFVAPADGATKSTPRAAPSATVIDGPSSAVTGLYGLTVARDGTGGLIYSKQVDGAGHVFASSLQNGAFQAPQELDSSLLGSSSQPQISGSEGGELVAAFINAGQLYVVEKSSASSAWSAPQLLASGASNPSLSMSYFGKAYLVFTVAQGSGDDVRSAYSYGGRWSVSPTVLNQTAGDDAGTGTGRPQVSVAWDGTAVAAWGEGGHVYVREIVGTSPSVDTERADPPSWGGVAESSADDPVVGTEGDSSYVSIVYREQLGSGVVTQTRVLDTRLRAGTINGTWAIDGLSSPGTASADQPAAGSTQTGTGWLTAEQTTSHNLYGDWLRGAEYPTTPVQINSQFEAGPPYAAPANAGNVAMLIAWQQDSGAGSATDVRLRYGPNGSDLGPEQVVSPASLGATNAALGLLAGGDGNGDAAVAWVQGSGASTRIVARQLFQPPGAFSPYSLFSYARTQHPLLSWSAANEQWGPIRYVLTLDGIAAGTTNATSIRAADLVGQGQHSWSITAYNLIGGAVTDRASTVFVDSLAPHVSLSLAGARHPHTQLRLTLRTNDKPAGLPAGDGSGVNSIQIRWGDGKGQTIRPATAEQTVRHAYSRRGTFRLQVNVTDRAGNRRTVTRAVKITKAPKRKPHAKRSA